MPLSFWVFSDLHFGQVSSAVTLTSASKVGPIKIPGKIVWFAGAESRLHLPQQCKNFPDDKAGATPTPPNCRAAGPVAVALGMGNVRRTHGDTVSASFLASVMLSLAKHLPRHQQPF